MKSSQSHPFHKAHSKSQSIARTDHGKPGSSPHTRVSEQLARDLVAQSPDRTSAETMSSVPQHSPMHPRMANIVGQEPATLETMRKRMSEALAQKQSKLSSTTPPNVSPKTRPVSAEEDGDYGVLPTSSVQSLATSGTVSTDSARTVRAAFDITPGPLRTPSYPFPRMQMKLQRGISSRSGPHHKPFTLLSPTSEPLEAFSSGQTPTQQPSSELSTPMGVDPSRMLPDDPNYPTPDLYDMVLMLSTEPGLESWWANVTEILSEAYGAERASLALPGDITDLENVPWGQQATFNIYGSEVGDSLAFDSNTTSEVDIRSVGRGSDIPPAFREAFSTSRRPPLLSRHSIAGAKPDASVRAVPARPAAPVRAISSVTGPREDRSGGLSRPRLARHSPTPQAIPTLEETKAEARTRQGSCGSQTSSYRCHVWRALQPLEAEPDPLLVRTGVAALFGKRKPVVLTRAYSEDLPPSPGPYYSMRGDSDGDNTPSIISKADSRLSARTTATSYMSKTFLPFDEYEQPEPSPWSQSPSPSPAARPDPSESPFFMTSSTIDEEAFQQNPPAYDYGATANQPLNAIGTDMSRTLVHIPLIQPVPSRSVLASTLRFPVAILSFLSPVTPYPRNLRHSLATFLPHLASTFSIAQQYSLLQDRLRGGAHRRSAAFGLGGTFSDEGSELELVTELSSQLNFNRDKSKNVGHHGGVYSPSGSTTSKESITGSIVSTPFLDQLGLNVGYPSTPGGRSGIEMIDSYFSAKRSQRTNHPTSSPGPRSVGEESAEKLKSKDGKALRSRSSTKKSSSTSKKGEKTGPSGAQVAALEGDSLESTSSAQHTAVPPTPSHRDSVIRTSEDNEKPLPDFISSMVLNAVPLQLFLAKPSSGDLVWTNRKFDAFRSQGEGRVRDPWKNVHPDDRDSIEKSWSEALKTGSQFTHYVRVRRFNSDSDYRWFVFRASTLLSNSGRLSYWIGSFLDFHEQYLKNLEASEREATMARDAKIRALADAIPQILFEAVEGEGIVSVNQQWHGFSGQTLDEARGLGFARHVHRDDLYKCGVLTPADASKLNASNTRSPSISSSSSSSNKTAQALQLTNSPKSIFTPDTSSLNVMIQQGALVEETDENGRTSYSTEIRLRSKGGEFRWHLIRLVKIQHELLNNGMASWYGTCTDIETRMGLERELNAANRKVNKEMESKTKFFANMSHEIRTPLNGILGSMPWLIESPLDHDQRRTVDTIQNSANNLRELVDNILDVTKVEAGKMTLIPKWFHIRSLCEEVVDTVSSRAIERGLELNYSLDVNVPTMIMGDPFRIRQVMLNLMGNSVKFTEQGEVYLHCHLHRQMQAATESSEGLLAFDVVDTGRGFNETEFKRLFKQFGQIEGASQHESGSGLGLFLSKQLVEMHGGELSVQSRAGEGSTFSFYVKVQFAAPGSEVTSPPTQPMRPLQRQSASFGPGTVRSSSDSRTPTMSSTQSAAQISSNSKQSPELGSPSFYSGPAMSPPIISPGSSTTHSIRSNSGNIALASSVSSVVVTPELFPPVPKPSYASERQTMIEKTAASLPQFRRSKSDNDGTGLAPELAHPEIYSIVVICPADHARRAIKQHIEHVVPHEIPANVTTLKDIGAFLDLMHSPAPPTFTHIVLDLPASSDIMLFMRQMLNFTAPVIPALVVITDHYQKRDIFEDFSLLTASGRKAFLVHKPVKPSVFAMIFDPAQLRKLSKDRAREVAQTSSDDFKKTTNQVKETIGNKGFRILLVEDSDVNRMVIARYLRRVGLTLEEARDGQECLDKVLIRPHGYYNLIICDIQMPRKNGYQTCTEIRQWELSQKHPALPIMALTANAMPEERAAAGNAGFTDYLTKPVDFNLLGVMMIGLLDRTKPHVFLRDLPADV